MKKIIFIVLILFSAFGYSQEDDSEDLKVGLVLSGGGAKGLAHIGALKVIEEAGIRIDYIGGTSMGAIIGALYASGYSAKQLDSIFNAVDFNTIIQDNIPRSSKTFYEKEESEKYAITLPFDKFQIGIPSGLSKGQNVYNLISKLTSHVNSGNDFSKLPIPFFCVATNVETGEEVILEKGYLPRAVSASGALPSLFSPVMVNDTLLVDGGVVNNYPVDEVRAKGMDIVIGIDVQDGLKNRNALRSAFDVLVQINNYRTIHVMKAKKERTDIYIQPNIENFSVVSFSEGRKIIDSGQKAADTLKNQLLQLASRQKKTAKQEVSFLERNTLYIKDVEVNGIENYTRAYVLGKLKLKTPAEVTYEEFSEGINNLSATNNFQDIDYRLVPAGEDGYNVVFTIRENNAKMLLRIGAHYDDLYRTAAMINITRKRLFTNNDIASLDFMVGDNLRYDFNYYIDKGFYWSVGLNSSFNFFEENVKPEFVAPETLTTENSQLNQIRLQYEDFTNQIYAETLFRRSFLLGGGIEHKYLRYISETIGIDENNAPRTIFESTNYYSTYGFLKYDTLDHTFFPNSGLFFEGDFHLYLFSHGRNNDFKQFSIAKAFAGYAASLGKLSAFLTTEGGFKIGGNNTRSLDFFVGGYGFKQVNNITPLYGYKPLSLRGNTYLKSALTVDYEIYKNNYLIAFGNISNVGDDLFEDGRWIDRINYIGFGLGYGLDTFLGPIELKYAFSPERDEGEWYVSAGFRF